MLTKCFIANEVQFIILNFCKALGAHNTQDKHVLFNAKQKHLEYLLYQKTFNFHDWLCHLATFIIILVQKGGQVTKPIVKNIL